jgi:hypothetical protein
MKKDKNNRKLYITGFCVLLILAASVSVSLAFLSNTDVQTNRQTGRELRIDLLEPDWWGEGQETASKLEPGMVIPKDPYVQNLSKDSIYVRMKLTIKDADGKEILTNSERYQGILKALRLNCSDGTTVSVYDVFKGTATNAGFFYASSWYYYGSKSGKEVTYTELQAEDRTSNLFDEMQVPIYRKSAKEKDADAEIYEGVFDKSFTIVVEAQGISAATETKNVKSTFDKQYKK